MKKLLWTLFIGTLGLCAGLGYFYWEKATAVPDWYAEAAAEELPSPPAVSSSPSPAAVSSSPATLPSPSPSFNTKPSSSPVVLSPTPSASPQVSVTPKALPQGVQSLKTQVRQNDLRSGALVNLTEMENAPSSRQSALAQRLLVVMPQLRGRQVYLGVQGQIVEINGQRQLSTDSKLSIGKVELPLDEVATQMSMTRVDLDRMILSYLQLDKPVSSNPSTSKAP